ncbi:MAG: hypothetical protein HUU37_09485, partial [Bdellovibrionales bacterium]|nr:hypothetical protein [Bdellovibrionales bacterium]
PPPLPLSPLPAALRAELAQPARLVAARGDDTLEAALVDVARSSLGETASTREMVDLAVTAVRLEVKRTVSEAGQGPKLEFRSRQDPELYTRAKKAIEAQRIREALASLHENELRWAADIVLTPSFGGEAIRGEAAWGFCQNNPFRNDLLETTP